MNNRLVCIHFNRQLTKSIYIFGIFTPNDFGFLIITLGLYILLFDNSLGLISILGCYPAYLLLLRLGKPPGYDVHFFKAYAYPRLIRPGRITKIVHNS
jgi:hypothetical protein